MRIEKSVAIRNTHYAILNICRVKQELDTQNR